LRFHAPLLLLLCSVLANPAAAQEAPTPAADSLTYRQVVERLAAGDTLVDFTELRFRFAAQPRPANVPDPRKLFEQAAEAADDSTARRLVDSALVHQYGHVGAHEAAARSFTERGDVEHAEFHRAVVRGIIRSIEAGGAETANGEFPVISIGEEYALLRARGLERVGQALASCGEYRCDILELRDPETGDEFTLTFLLTWWRDE
jgi:hypothetical protein